MVDANGDVGMGPPFGATTEPGVVLSARPAPQAPSHPPHRTLGPAQGMELALGGSHHHGCAIGAPSPSSKQWGSSSLGPGLTWGQKGKGRGGTVKLGLLGWIRSSASTQMPLVSFRDW